MRLLTATFKVAFFVSTFYFWLTFEITRKIKSKSVTVDATGFQITFTFNLLD